MLGSVGSSSGSVHKQRQGTGLATVLEGDRALDTYDGLAALEKGKAAAKLVAKQTALDAARERMLKFVPERWLRHESIIKKELTDWHNQGAEMMANGTDPYNSTDQASLDWRAKQIEIFGLAEASKQMQKVWEDDQQKISSAEAGAYTTPSLINRADYYYGTDLKEIAKTGKLPPPLVKAKPMLDVQDYISKVMADINPTLNGNELTDTDRWNIVKETLKNPAKAADLNESLNSMFMQLRPEEQYDINGRAKAAGRSVPEQITFDFVKRYETQRAPFNYNTWKKSLVDRVKVSYKDWRGADNFSKKVDETELMKNINIIARDAFVGDDRALYEYEAVLPRAPGVDDGTYRDAAEEHLAKRIREEVATQEEAGVTVRGQDKKDVEVSQKLWLPDIMSKDPDKYREASGYLNNIKGVMGNLNVMNTQVQQGFPYPELRITLQGGLNLDQVKSEIPNDAGEFITKTVQQGTDTEIFIPINEQTQNWLLSFHDMKLKQTGIGYGGAYDEAAPSNIPGLAPDAPKPTNLVDYKQKTMGQIKAGNSPAAPVPETFKFKQK